ncbi:hypothetical protein TcasGA2_TC001819 [Tribolium castaneum]|uniref:YqaJ viral recombinase domain-containing protein n=1 Tax=Tribolium castaneum TaxID=7070 RepID=D7EJ68_TRICA|nr:hypothetical protein TcasGA2_TC001819 [Tribolium castaneum]
MQEALQCGTDGYGPPVGWIRKVPVFRNCNVVMLCNINELEMFSSTDVKCYWSKKKYKDKFTLVPLNEYKWISESANKTAKRSLDSAEANFDLNLRVQKLPESNLAKQISHCRKRPKIAAQSNDTVYDNVFNNIENSELINCLEVILPERECCQRVYQQLCGDLKEIVPKTCNSRSLWMKERQFRVIGSRCYQIFTYRGDDWKKKSSSYFWPKSFSNKFVEHGRKYENEARQAYITKYNAKVIETGLLVPSNQSWLGFSPDGIVVDEEDNPQLLLEIKCPYESSTVCPF